MEIKNLEIILALDSEKHFNRAAEKLNISQPALSMKLKSLENEIGIKLVKRGKNYIGLTEEGEILKEKFKYIVKEGVVRSARDGDIGAIFGIGFPPFLGGPFSYMDTIGISNLVERLDYFAQKYGNKFTPAPILVKMAEENRDFY